MTQTESDEESSKVDKLLAELEHETLSKDSSKSNDDTVVTPSSNTDTEDEEYLNNLDNAEVKQIPKGKEKYYGL